VIYYSPLQWMYWYDKPDDYQGEPELEFWDALPTVWDDTKVIGGEIGQYITVARRSGDEWFVGTITGNDPRELEIPLSFLDKDRSYRAVIYSDDETVNTRTHVKTEQAKVTKETVLHVKLKPSGGRAIRIIPFPAAPAAR